MPINMNRKITLKSYCLVVLSLLDDKGIKCDPNNELLIKSHTNGVTVTECAEVIEKTFKTKPDEQST